MHYDDEARRFNFISGLVCGVILGSGLALIVSPRAPRPPRIGRSRLRRTVRRSRGRYAPRFEQLRDELAKVRTSAQRAAERAREEKSPPAPRSRKRRVHVEV